jgi:vacuolar-type H+-ATPase subunit E/Vma4
MARKDKTDRVRSAVHSGDRQGDIGELVSAMHNEAAQEVEKILSEAKKEADRKQLYAERQAESILTEARNKAEMHSKQMRQQALSGVAIEIKRRTMKIQEDVFRDIVQKAVDRIQSRAADDDFQQVLLMLIVEAAIGLDAPAARINANEKQRAMITGELLHRAERRVEALTGKDVRLSLSDQEPLRKLGVVLTAEDNKTAYDNSIDTRLVRKSTEIRQFIYDRLFHA